MRLFGGQGSGNAPLATRPHGHDGTSPELPARFTQCTTHSQDGLGGLQLHQLGTGLPEFRRFLLIVGLLGRGTFSHPVKVLSRDAFQSGVEHQSIDRICSSSLSPIPLERQPHGTLLHH